MIYFTAGLFFGDKEILKSRRRPFLSVEHMDTCLVDYWNNSVKENDTVYILGDMFSATISSPAKYLKILNGKKHLIYTNADKKWMKKTDVENFFSEHKHYTCIDYGGKHLTICHNYLPCLVCEYDNYLIYANGNEHTHSDYWFVRLLSDNILDASVDINNYRPVTFEEMQRNNKKHKIRKRLYREICEDERLLEGKILLTEKLKELLNSDICDEETEKYIKSWIVEFEESLKCERYSHHGCLYSFLQQDKIPPREKPIEIENTYIRRYAHRKGEKMSPTSENEEMRMVK